MSRSRLAAALVAAGIAATGCASAVEYSAEAIEVQVESISPTAAPSVDEMRDELTRRLQLARPPEVCGHVTGGNGKQLPVAVLAGEVDCVWAVELANQYLHDPSVVKEGQGQYAQIEGWMCMWPYVDGRSHAESYLQCDDDPVNPVNSFRIGE